MKGAAKSKIMSGEIFYESGWIFAIVFAIALAYALGYQDGKERGWASPEERKQSRN
jgi:hypothetical protein